MSHFFFCTFSMGNSSCISFLGLGVLRANLLYLLDRGEYMAIAQEDAVLSLVHCYTVFLLKLYCDI